jgi:hypothetical protein
MKLGGNVVKTTRPSSSSTQGRVLVEEAAVRRPRRQLWFETKSKRQSNERHVLAMVLSPGGNGGDVQPGGALTLDCASPGFQNDLGELDDETKRSVFLDEPGCHP